MKLICFPALSVLGTPLIFDSATVCCLIGECSRAADKKRNFFPLAISVGTPYCVVVGKSEIYRASYIYQLVPRRKPLEILVYYLRIHIQ
jgi:hypothetical protein